MNNRYSDSRLIDDKTIAMMNPTDRQALGVLTPDERRHKGGFELEHELQRVCENWLTLHGFRRRSPEDICRAGDCAGWFIHIHEAKRNPILLDLLILFADGHYREIELKSRCGKPSVEQDNLIRRGGVLCRTLEEFIIEIERKAI